MAKVTRSGDGEMPRPRGTRATLSADTPLDAPEDSVTDDQMSDADFDVADVADADGSDADGYGGADEVDDEDESLRLGPRDVALTSADELLYTRPGTRVSARNLAVPGWANSNPLTRFMAESYIELRKVTWPTRDEAWNMTLVVIAMSAVVAILLGIADFGLQHVLVWVVNLGK